MKAASFIIIFCRENFLRLDIYFGEMKYESVVQKRDYDIGTLFSG
jgi:hypothetical protein